MTSDATSRFTRFVVDVGPFGLNRHQVFVERLEVTPDGLSFEDLRESVSESELETIREALRELVADLIDILAMLTGDVLVQQLIKEIDGRHKS